MLLRDKKVQTLEKGDRIVFTRGGDTEQQVGTVRSLEVNGKYVTVWYYTDAKELSLVLAEKGETIFVTTKAR